MSKGRDLVKRPKGKVAFFINTCRNQKYLIYMTLPGVVILLLFNYLPIYGIQIAFKNYNIGLGIWGSPWSEPIIKWFKMFLSSPMALVLIRNTLILGFATLIFNFPAPIVLSLVLNEVKYSKIKRAVQTISYLPHFVSAVIIVGILKELVAIDGPINTLIISLGGKYINFMSEPGWFRTLFVTSTIWQDIGWGTIIYLAALSNVDPQMYEAAKIDGANRWHCIRYITLPSIMATITILFILNTGKMLGLDFQKVMLMYNPQTYETADIIDTYVYREGFENMRYSFSAAIGLMMSFVSFFFLTVTNKVSKTFSETSLW